MPEENVVSIPHSTALSPAAFHDETKHYLNFFSHTRSSLAAIYNTYSNKKPIWPEQYRRIITLIHTLEEPVQELCKLLSNSARLPESVIPHHYLPLATLQNTAEILAETLSLITRLTALTSASPYKAQSKQTITLNAQIQRQLELLIGNSEDILDQFHSLFDKTHFEAKQISQSLSYVHAQKQHLPLSFHEYKEYSSKDTILHSTSTDEPSPIQEAPVQEGTKSSKIEQGEDRKQHVQRFYTKLCDTATHELSEILRTYMREKYARNGSINEVTEETFSLLRTFHELAQQTQQ